MEVLIITPLDTYKAKKCPQDQDIQQQDVINQWAHRPPFFGGGLRYGIWRGVIHINLLVHLWLKSSGKRLKPVMGFMVRRFHQGLLLAGVPYKYENPFQCSIHESKDSLVGIVGVKGQDLPGPQG